MRTSSCNFIFGVLAFFAFLAIAAFAADPVKPAASNAAPPKPPAAPPKPTATPNAAPPQKPANTQPPQKPANTQPPPKPANTQPPPKPANTQPPPKPANAQPPPKPANAQPPPKSTNTQPPKPANTQPPKTVQMENAKPAPRVPAERRCSGKVVEYLQQAVTQRDALLARETSARAKLNELRSVLAEEKDGQRDTSAETKKSIAVAWAEMQSATTALSHFEEETLKKHGDIPKICIDEVQSLQKYESPESKMDAYMRMLELLALHGRLFARTARGVFDFAVAEYMPMLDKYDEISTNFRGRSRAMLGEIAKESPAFGEADLAGKGQLLLRYAEAGSLAAVPYAVAGGVALVSLLFAPFIVAAVLLPNLLWRVWAKLFVLHHLYGTTSDGVLAALREIMDLAGKQDWSALKDRSISVFLGLAGDNTKFYNGIFGVSMMILTAWILLMLMIVWIRGIFSCFGCRSRSSNKKDVNNRSNSAEKRKKDKVNPKHVESQSVADKNRKKKA